MRAHRLALAELRRLTSGKLLRLALVAMLVIPSLYAGLYLYANKDPYANLGHIPVAVVVEDAGTTLASGERLQVGQQVASTLVDGHTFDWHRVTRAEAVRGVDDEEYDFALIIPRDFSAALASAGSQHPRQATLEQYTNDTNGYLARTISNTVVAEVTRSVASQVSTTAAAQLLDGMSTIHGKLQQAADGAGKLADGGGRLVDGSGRLATGATSLRDGTAQLRDGAVRLAQGADSARSGAGELSAGASRLHDGLATLDSRTAALPGQTRQLADGAHQVADGNARLADGARRLATGATAASTGAGQLKAGADTLHDGASKVAAGAHQVAAGNAQIAQAGQLAQQAATQVDQVRKERRGALQDQIRALQAQSASLQTAIDALPADTDPAAVARLRQIKADLDRRLATAQTELDRIDRALDQVSGTITKASGKLTTLATGSQQVAEGADRLTAGSATLAGKLGELQRGTATLATGATTLSGGADAAAAGAGKVAAGADALAKGSAQLHDGIAQADAGSAKLADGASRLDDGLGTLASGAHTLATNEQKALDGAQQLADGAGSLRDGAGTLQHGAQQLRDQLAAGKDQVPSYTAEQRKAAAQAVGNPVAVRASNPAQAANYGAGLAPFFVSLSLWIGAYVLFLLIKTLSTRALAAQQPAWRVAVSGWLTPALLAVGQSLLVFGLVLKGLGFHVQHPLWAIAFMAFVSLTYAAILHALASRLGAVGKFLGLILLVVQLVSAGGTFPWQTLPGPLQALHHVLPMSYAIDGLRHLMYGGRMGFVALDLLVLAGFLAAALTASTWAAHRARIWTPARIKPDLVL
ncbi:YhgE/Pip domain-containing protein [Arsenicicoccus sp. oral taxon 190]|uniref:YhgE/Pip domain-containing protein n=1 Tax=Arsenicicoccus sp. oral taxon 190 TaxID=1658671 RepID=UPI00067A033A|nr:YhgE/Pip domain-containing protein [Arsenicicoccus sp. oral taxon 190]AKT52317.1 hypothetical protein ADJ73_15410 [Arsenicicoccus sp. oral taxon 190]